MIEFELTQLPAMLLSASIEAAVAALVVRATGWPSRGPGIAALAAAVATLISHPVLWASALALYPHLGYLPSLVLLETLVAVFEALVIALIAGLSLPHALVVSLVANAASLSIGLLLS